MNHVTLFVDVNNRISRWSKVLVMDFMLVAEFNMIIMTGFCFLGPVVFNFYSKHCYNQKLITLEITNAVACTVNMKSILCDASRVVKYDPRVTPEYGASL